MTAPSDAIYPFTVHQVFAMVDAGILEEDIPIELLDGTLYRMTDEGYDHGWTVVKLHLRLLRAYGDHFAVGSEKPLPLPDHNLTVPDLAVYRGDAASYNAWPVPSDNVLVVEVTLNQHDRDAKKVGIYARAGLPECWLVDVPGQRLVRHTEPSSDGYGKVEELALTEEIEIPGLGSRVVVGELFG
jgi:Uma2 family endonuclease